MSCKPTKHVDESPKHSLRTVVLRLILSLSLETLRGDEVPFSSFVFALNGNQLVYNPGFLSQVSKKRNLNFCSNWCEPSLCCFQCGCPQYVHWVFLPLFLPKQSWEVPLCGPCTKRERKSLHWRSVDFLVSPGQTRNQSHLHNNDSRDWQYYTWVTFKFKMASMGYLFLG